MRLALSESDLISATISSFSDLVALLLAGGERVVAQRALDLLVLQLAELLVVGGDEVEGLEHLRLELRLHGGERKRILEIVLFVVEFFLGDALAILVVAGGRRCRGGRRVAVAAMTGRLAVHAFGQRLRRRGLGVRALIGGFEIDDVAEQNLAFVQLVAPDDDGLEGERAFAQARRSSPRGRPRCAWRWRSRPRATEARRSPSRADTCAPDRRCARSARPWSRPWRWG